MLVLSAWCFNLGKKFNAMLSTTELWESFDDFTGRFVLSNVVTSEPDVFDPGIRPAPLPCVAIFFSIPLDIHNIIVSDSKS